MQTVFGIAIVAGVFPHAFVERGDSKIGCEATDASYLVER